MQLLIFIIILCKTMEILWKMYIFKQFLYVKYRTASDISEG